MLKGPAIWVTCLHLTELLSVDLIMLSQFHVGQIVLCLSYSKAIFGLPDVCPRPGRYCCLTAGVVIERGFNCRSIEPVLRVLWLHCCLCVCLCGWKAL
jgi:hypothetical protein